ncbi:MAG: secretin N-terminal domain-containing protein, partial [Candidatus Poribacteria bacterium]
EESNKPTQQYIKALNEELEELKTKLKQLPPENDEEARDYRERIAEIQKELAQLKRQRVSKLAEAKAKRVRKAAQEKKLSSVEAQRRIERLKNDIEEAREKVQELKRTNPDSPSLKELRAHIAERERMIKDLTAQIRKARHQQPPKRIRGEQTQLKIFPLKNIDAETAFRIVREFITDGRGIVVPVFHTNSLIIRDTQKNLRDIETIIEHIDVKGKS